MAYDGLYEEQKLVNPYFIRQIPVKKSDVKDEEWITTCLLKELTKVRYVPNNCIRRFRQYNKHRRWVYFRRAAPGEGGTHGIAVGGPGGNIPICDAQSILRKIEKRQQSNPFARCKNRLLMTLWKHLLHFGAF